MPFEVTAVTVPESPEAATTLLGVVRPSVKVQVVADKE